MRIDPREWQGPQMAWILVLGCAVAIGAEGPASEVSSPPSLESQRPAAERLLVAARDDADFAYRRLGELCDRHGPRITGSHNLEAAIDWVLATMRTDGLSHVQGEPVGVPHWVRGAESLEMTSPRHQTMKVLGIGGGVGTPPGGITAEVLVVGGFEDLKRRADEARGRIVLFNLPFTEYGTTVAIRTRGATEASRAGAVASLIRSVGPFSMQTPHTGMMQSDASVRPIPHAAITVEDAAMLQRMQDRGEKVVLSLRLESQSLPEATSRNVVAELPGREHPEEVVVVSGHIDSWDVGQGAMDDGGGCVAAWEAVRLVKQLGLQPRRTLRVVLWTGEESGIWGAKAYRKAHAAELPRHILAIESDRGVFAPEGFAFTGSGAAMGFIRAAGRFLEPIRAGRITAGNGGMDVMELIQGGVPVMDLVVDRTRYFWYHHSEADTVDKLDPKDLASCIGALAVMAYTIADLPEPLPR
jgi:carboxypeptidase Q